MSEYYPQYPGCYSRSGPVINQPPGGGYPNNNIESQLEAIRAKLEDIRRYLALMEAKRDDIPSHVDCIACHVQIEPGMSCIYPNTGPFCDGCEKNK